MIYNFVRKGRTERVKRNISCSEVNQGGLKPPNVQKMMKAAQFWCIQRYFQSEKRVWKVIFKRLLTTSNTDLDMFPNSE